MKFLKRVWLIFCYACVLSMFYLFVVPAKGASEPEPKPGMVNLDTVKTDAELHAEMKAALEGDDPEAFIRIQVQMAKNTELRILQEAKKLTIDERNDQAVLAQRGIKPLTKQETDYYMEVIGTGGFGGTQALLPATVFERVFLDLQQNRPLLAEINFQNTTGMTELISRNNDAAAAWWDVLTATIAKLLEVAFTKEKVDMYKLSAYMPVAKSMLDLGPQWIDLFVRTFLAESIGTALELAIVAGTGKKQPIGMIKDLAAPVVDGEYADKTGTPLADLDPVTLGTSVMAPLTKGGKRAVTNVLLIVNPLDYWSKIFPATTVLTASGTYVYGVLPIPAKIIQSVAVAQGTMIAGMGKDYFMGIGSAQKIDYSDHYKFLEDERTYIAKQYANGKPLDNSSFLVFDISGMEVAGDLS